MKSYIEVSETCQFVDYLETDVRTEFWMDATHLYKCIWLSQNDTYFPTTITREIL